MKFVALLRGINVGGKNKLPMKDLVSIFERAGCDDVRHYIQSGNVVFQTDGARAARIAKLVGERIEQDHGLRVPVVVRTATEIHAITRSNPYLAEASPALDPKHLHVLFLAEAPGKGRASALDPGRSPPDAFALRGREVYLHLPGGVARTKLTNAYFDSALATTSTMRNWATVLKLADMCAA
jgi:uncharacterized protein (DUF1697 family)